MFVVGMICLSSPSSSLPPCRQSCVLRDAFPVFLAYTHVLLLLLSLSLALALWLSRCLNYLLTRSLAPDLGDDRFSELSRAISFTRQSSCTRISIQNGKHSRCFLFACFGELSSIRPAFVYRSGRGNWTPSGTLPLTVAVMCAVLTVSIST